MGLTYSIMIHLGQRNQRKYQYVPKPKRYNKHKKSKISDTEIINPIELIDTKVEDERQIVAVFERHVEKNK
jgi:hypothetical protein